MLRSRLSSPTLRTPVLQLTTRASDITPGVALPTQSLARPSDHRQLTVLSAKFTRLFSTTLGRLLGIQNFFACHIYILQLTMAAQSKLAPLPPWGYATAGAAGAVFANTLVYPLDL